MWEMIENIRKFKAGPDPFGRTWDVEFRWLQTAISIRHSDSVDVKWEIRCGDEVLEKVVALMHPHLLKLSKAAGRPLTDPWCMRLAAAHLIRMIETAEDFEKTLVTVTYEQLEEYNAKLDSLVAAPQ
jgi:hypothetical protein